MASEGKHNWIAKMNKKISEILSKHFLRWIIRKVGIQKEKSTLAMVAVPQKVIIKVTSPGCHPFKVCLIV